MKFRFHVVGLPHTETTAAHVACAYTQKVVKFCRMMAPRGHEIFLYSGEENSAPCREHIPVVSSEDRLRWFGSNPMALFEKSHPSWVETNQKTAQEIKKRATSRDLVLLIGGNCQALLADLVSPLLAVEWGIGYEGVFSRYRCFESHVWRHYLYGKLGVGDGSNLDAVIPNFFDKAELPLSPIKDDYFLFIGRIVKRKGPEIAVETCRKLGAKLVVAGQKTPEVNLPYGPRVEYAGVVGVEERAKLMGKARGVFVPTQYLEPFGGVAVEAMLCGTPVITSDWGAFVETVSHGVSGFRCNTPADYVRGAARCSRLDPAQIRDHALKYSLENIAPLYEEWFTRLRGLTK